MNGKTINILLVEDDLAHAEIVKRNFADFRIANDLQHVADGQAALDYLNRQGCYSHLEGTPLPRLVLLDLRIPKVSGLEVLRRIKEVPQLRNIAVIVLTTSNQDADITRAYELGANSYLTKPIGFADFCAMLKALGYYWLTWNHYAA